MNVPGEFFGLTSMFLCFRVRSPKILDHVRERITGLSGRRFHDISQQAPGEAVLVVAEATEEDFRDHGQKIYIRPPRCRHGGETKAEI
jgi:hypothetical protein